jgi:hypothetical protein
MRSWQQSSAETRGSGMPTTHEPAIGSDRTAATRGTNRRRDVLLLLATASITHHQSRQKVA